MGRVLGFVLLAVLVVAIVWFLLKHRKKKTDCERVVDVAEKGADTLYGTKTDKISDSYDSKLCSAITAIGKPVLSGALKVVGSKPGQAVVSVGASPVNAVREAFSGNGGAALSDLTGATALNKLNYGTPLAQQSCSQLAGNCATEKRTGLANRNGAYASGNGPYCTQFRTNGCK